MSRTMILYSAQLCRVKDSCVVIYFSLPPLMSARCEDGVGRRAAPPRALAASLGQASLGQASLG